MQDDPRGLMARQVEIDDDLNVPDDDPAEVKLFWFDSLLWNGSGD